MNIQNSKHTSSSITAHPTQGARSCPWCGYLFAWSCHALLLCLWALDEASGTVNLEFGWYDGWKDGRCCVPQVLEESTVVFTCFYCCCLLFAWIFCRILPWLVTCKTLKKGESILGTTWEANHVIWIYMGLFENRTGYANSMAKVNHPKNCGILFSDKLTVQNPAAHWSWSFDHRWGINSWFRMAAMNRYVRVSSECWCWTLRPWAPW